MCRFGVCSYMFFGAMAVVAPLAIAATIEPGDVIVADYQAFGGNGGIILLNPATGLQTNVSSGANFRDPAGIAIEANGNLIVSDFNAFGGLGGLLRVDPTNGAQTTLSSGGNFVDPEGVAIGSNGEIYVADSSAFGNLGGVIRVDPMTGVQTVVSSGGSFVDPVTIAIEASGDLLVADYNAFGGNGGIIRVNPATGSQTTVSSGGSFQSPYGIAVAGNGQIYVADFLAFGGSGGVIRVDPVTGQQSTISSGGYFVEPWALAIASNGDLLVSDYASFGGSGGVTRVDPVTGAQEIAYPNGNFNEPLGLAVAPGTPPVPSTDLTVAGRMIIGAEMTFGNVTVLSGGTVSFDALVTVTDDMTISGTVMHSVRLANGALPDGLRLSVGDSLVIESSGAINVVGSGLLGATGGSAPAQRLGEAYDPSTGEIVLVTPAVSGGSHGGLGGSSFSPVYGDEQNPTQFGAGGGGGGFSAGQPGGNGGGAVNIQAGTLVVIGPISANGGNGLSGFPGSGGGGAGGTVSLDVGTLAGAGSITANGGLSGNGGGSGGGAGGRIAIRYGTRTFTGSILAKGGTPRPEGCCSGTAGTIFLKDNVQTYGDLIIDGGGVTGTQQTNVTLVGIYGPRTFRNVDITNRGYLTIPSAVGSCSVTGRLQISGTSSFQLDPAVTFTAAVFRLVTSSTMLNRTNWTVQHSDDFQVQSGQLTNDAGARLSLPRLDGTNFVGGTLTNRGRLDVATDEVTVVGGARLELNAQSDLTGDSTLTNLQVSGQLQVDFPLRVFDDLEVRAGGVIEHKLRNPSTPLPGLRLTVGDSLVVAGSINVGGRGLLGATGGPTLAQRLGEAYDPTTGAIVLVTPEVSGASYGGLGGSQVSPVYGDEQNPTQFGAGGGGGAFPNPGDQPGGNGGGAIFIEASVLVVNASGAISADGGNGLAGFPGSGGGGSGGTVSLDVGSLAGAGSITANGGLSGNGGGSGGGGGGRIAVRYGTRTFTGSILAKGGTPRPNGCCSGTAGTIFLKDSAQTYGDLIVDGGDVTGNQQTYVTLVDIYGPRTFRNVEVKNRGFLVATAGISPLTTDALTVSGNGLFTVGAPIIIEDLNVITSGVVNFSTRVDYYGGTITLADGTLAAADTFSLKTGKLAGTGTVSAPFVNEALVSPGISAGSIVMVGGYVQRTSGELRIEVGGLTPGTQFDKLSVAGQAVLAGTLSFVFVDGFAPSLGNRFLFLNYDTRSGEFETITGLGENQAVAYIDLTAVLIAGSDLQSNSSVENVLVVSPAGNVPFHATLRNSAGIPVVGSDNVWLDLEGVTGLFACGARPRAVYPQGPSDSLGVVTFFVSGGGCTFDPVKVMTSYGMIAEVPIKSLDRTGNLVVTGIDFTGVSCNDYDNSGVTDQQDWGFFARHLGQTCIDTPTNFTDLEILTVPGPEEIYSGETIEVCARVTNTINAPAVLDSVVFLRAGWGIAQPWTRFAKVTNVPVGPFESVTTCQPFVVPAEPHHGCFQVFIYPRYNPSFKIVPNRRLAGTEVVQYGVRREGDRSWAYIGLSNGQEFVAVAIDSMDDTADYSQFRWLGLDEEALQEISGLRNPELLDLIHSPQGETAAFLWGAGFPKFDGSPEQLIILKDLSIDFAFLHSVSEVPTSSQYAVQACRVNGCGPQWFDLDWDWLVPDLDFTDCCDDHDWCYCGNRPNGGQSECTEEDRRRCDAEFFNCAFNACNGNLRCIKRVPHYYHGVNTGGAASFGSGTGGPNAAGCCRENPSASGCGPPPGGGGEGVQANRDSQRRPPRSIVGNLKPTASVTSLNDGVTRTEIPIGTESGQELLLEVVPLLPSGWSYSISHSLFVTAMDTVTLEIRHDRILKCGQNGSVLVHAYGEDGQFAGNAELAVYSVGRRGDLDNNDAIDAVDLQFLVDYLFHSGDAPYALETAELTEDGLVSIADATFLAEYLFASGSNPENCGDGPPVVTEPDPRISLFRRTDAASTVVVLNSAIDLRGIHVELRGPSGSVPQPSDSLGLDVLWHQNGDTLSVGLLDLDAAGVIPAGRHDIVEVPGGFEIIRAWGVDEAHALIPAVTGPVTPVTVSELTASQQSDGAIMVSWVSAARAEFDLLRQDVGRGSQLVKVNLEPIHGNGRLRFLDDSDIAKAGGHFQYLVIKTGESMPFGPIEVFAQDRRIPEAFALGRSVPSPARDETTLFYDLPRGGELSIQVYDVSGRLVRDLVSGHQEAGRGRVVWNGRSNRGDLVPQGIYLYRMQSSGFVASRKIVFVR